MSAPPLPDRTRAGNLALLGDALVHSDCGVETLEPFTWVSREEDSDDDEDWLGIFSPRTGATATSRAYGGLVERNQRANLAW